MFADGEKVDAFVKEQGKFLHETMIKIEESTIAFHREHCPNPDGSECEDFYMFMMLGGINREMERLEKLRQQLRERLN